MVHLIDDVNERREVEDRRRKNREAAKKSRTRKKKQIDDLESELSLLRQQSTDVENEIIRLENQKRTLTAVQSEHEKICPFTYPSHQYHCTY